MGEAVKKQALVPTEVTIDGEETDAVSSGINAIVAHNRELSAMVRELVGLQSSAYAQLAAQCENMQLIQIEREKAHLKNVELREQLLDRQEERRAKRAEAKQRAELLGEIAGDARALLPAIVNRFGKVPVLTPAESTLLRPFVESLSERELAGITAALTPAKQAALQQILGAIPDTPTGPMHDPEPEEEPPNGAHQN